MQHFESVEYILAIQIIGEIDIAHGRLKHSVAVVELRNDSAKGEI